MQNKKAEGVDNIENEIIKYFPDKILAIILRLFNSFLDTGQIIEELCEGLIAPIFKENYQSNPDNYRGIKTREQIGFREKIRTMDHIFTLKTIVNNHLNPKKVTRCSPVLLTLEAYDPIHHEALSYKFIKNGINGSFLTLIKDLYAKTKCAVKIHWKQTDF